MVEMVRSAILVDSELWTVLRTDFSSSRSFQISNAISTWWEEICSVDPTLTITSSGSGVAILLNSWDG
jgi:hypothetical protein